MHTRSIIYLLVVCPLFTGACIADEFVRFAAIGDYGNDAANNNGTENPDMRAVANLIVNKGVDAIITTGDNSYGIADLDTNIGKYYANFIGDYGGVIGTGAPINAFFPSPGNHDYTDGGGISAYLNYFTLPGTGIPTTDTSGTELYYDFVLGPVHFFAIDSNSDTGSGSDQRNWLQTQLAASSAPWKIVYDHHPPYSSGLHGSSVYMQWPFEKWGATAVLSGHDHDYERIIRDDDGDGTDMPYLVTGAGGNGTRPFLFPVQGSEVRYRADYGALIVEASEKSIRFEFWSVAGGSEGTLIDSYCIFKSSGGQSYAVKSKIGSSVVFCL